jgi:zinc transport system substrate-binding protein
MSILKVISQLAGAGTRGVSTAGNGASAVRRVVAGAAGGCGAARRDAARQRVEATTLAAAFAACLALGSCGSGGGRGAGQVMAVSIEPLRYIVEEIAGDDFRVVVLTPPGANPETYEPTPAQMGAAEDALLLFSTGLVAFECELTRRLPAPERAVDLSEGIALIEADHTHEKGSGADHGRKAADNHRHSRDVETDHGQKTADDHTHDPAGSGAAHAHLGADPHIWMSPRALARMARTAYGRIHELYPDSLSYSANYERLKERLETLDAEVSRRLAASPVRAFMILHPGLTYYARDYGLRQIAIERDGKEPSARQLAETVAEARAAGVTRVFYQNEFPVRTVEVAAAEIGSHAVEIDILGYDVPGNIMKITELIAQ